VEITVKFAVGANKTTQVVCLSMQIKAIPRMSTFHVDPDIKKAKTISTDFYLHDEHYQASKEKIFAPSWQYIGHLDQFTDNLNIHPVVLLEGYLDEPLVLTKDATGELHCLTNVCTHRGNLVAYEPLKSSQLRCKYHGRVFGLDGKFKFMPEFEEVEDFPCEHDHLYPLQTFQIGKLLFASLHPTLSAQTYFGAMMDRIAWMPLDQMQYRADLSATYQVNAHWALYCENYLEGFHIPFVHPSLSGVIEYGSYVTELFELSNLQLALAKPGESAFDLPATSPDFGKQIAAYYFWVYPNMMFNFYPWGLSFNLVEPKGIASCKVTFQVFVWDASKLDQGAGSGLDQVEKEDEEVVQNVQKGIRSRFYTHGRFAPHREQGTHHFHGLLAKSLG
jgi:choline monooxygenase